MSLTRLFSVIILAGAVLLLSCDDNPAVRSRYHAENLYYQAEKLSEGAQVRPELTPPEQFGQITYLYGQAWQAASGALAGLDSINNRNVGMEILCFSFQNEKASFSRKVSCFLSRHSAPGI